MAFEQDANCLPTDAGDQLTLHSLLGDEAYRPTRPALRRISAHHRNNPLLLRRVQNLLGPGPLSFVERRLQAAVVVAMGNFTDCFRS